MGAEESRPTISSSATTSITVKSVSGCAFPNIRLGGKDSPKIVEPWQLLHQTSVEKWANDHAEAANFKETTLQCSGGLHKDCFFAFCTSRQEILTLNKAPSFFRFRKRSRFHKLVEHFEYNCIPAHMSSIHNFRLHSVLCVLDHLVVLHFSRDLTAQFGLLDIRRNKLLAVFGRQSFQKPSPDQLSGQISPDRSRCFIRIPRTVWTQPMKRNMIQVFDLLHAGVLLMEVEVGDSPNVFAFDPRTRWQRLACSNFRIGPSNSLSLVDAECWQVLCTNSHLSRQYPVLEPYLKDVRYVRDGSLIVATLVDAFCHCRERRMPRSHPVDVNVLVLDANNAHILHTFDYSRYTCTRHACPTNYLPLLSRCGNRVALTVNPGNNPDTTYVQVFKLPPPMRLQNACRVIICQNCAFDNLVDLPLPTKIINFLHFRDEYCTY